jgi:glycosyltransferase involved in cell wall biosynthesis
MKKTIILHDTFLYKWGWERLIMMMWKALKSDIASGFFSAGSFDLRKEWFEWKMISLSSEVFKKWFRHLKLKYAFLCKTGFLRDYDNVIFSWDSISAVRNCKKDTKKIYYCHTPPRYLYDLHELYLKKVPLVLKPAFKIFCFVFKKLYESDIKKMDLVLTNSKNTQKRIKNFLWIDAEILYPPVDLELFKYLDQKDYYLSFARLSDAKRVDRVVEAFKQLPDKKLVVIYWENDPQREKIFELAAWYSNIEFKTLPGNVWFTDYVGNSIATIYIPIDEDFWMSPVESMSAWKPVLWVNEWWLKETIIPPSIPQGTISWVNSIHLDSPCKPGGENSTWVLINPECKIEDIIDAVKYLTPEKCLEMKERCEERARDFSLESFEKKINEYIK